MSAVGRVREEWGGNEGRGEQEPRPKGPCRWYWLYNLWGLVQNENRKPLIQKLFRISKW